MKDRSEESNSSRMHRHRYLYCVYCLTPPTTLCSDMYYCVLQHLIVYCRYFTIDGNECSDPGVIEGVYSLATEVNAHIPLQST